MKKKLQFLNNAKNKKFPAKKIVYNSSNKHIYYVNSGKVLLAIETYDKNHFRIINGESTFLAIPEIYTDKLIKTSLLSLNDSELFYWTKEEFEMGVSMYPEMALLAITSLCSLLRYINEQNERLEEEEDNELVLNFGSSNVNDRELENLLFDVAFTEEKSTLENAYNKIGVNYKPGELIFNQGDKSNDIYIILEGDVDIVLNVEGEEMLLNTIGAESFLGEMSHFDSKPRSASAIAKNNVRMIKFTKDTFNIIFQLHPKWTIKLIKTLSERIVNTYIENIG